MKSLLEKLKLSNHDRLQFYLILFLLISGLAYFSIDYLSSHNQETKNEDSVATDTFIPLGFTLVPIELQNAEAISSLFEQTAIVDLYSSFNLESKKPIKVGRHLRMLRAPLNPNKFSVLVPESAAGQIVSAPGSLYAVVLSKKIIEQGQLTPVEKRINHVQYFNGGGK